MLTRFATTALLSLAALQPLARAWTIVSSDAAVTTTPTVVLGTNEPLTRTWTVSGDALTALELQTIGRVFVDYDASLAADGAVAAKVVFSGNNSKVLDALEVTTVEKNDDAIKLRFKNDEFEGQGYLLTQVFVASKQALTSVSASWSGDVILGEDVVAQTNTSATIALSHAGSGDLFAGSDSSVWSVDALSLSLGGSGDIQLVADSLAVADSIEIALAGSGDVAIVADKAEAGSLASMLGGSGEITVQSNGLTVQNLTSDIAGSGGVTYSKKGSCKEQRIAIAGTGDVAAGSIVCVNTQISLVGSGDALVQTTGNLSVSSLFGGDIRYYGDKPANINVEGLFSFRGTHKNKNVKPTKINNFNEYDVKELPDRAPVYVVVKIKASFFSDEPSVRYELELDEYDEETVNEFLKRQDSPYYQPSLETQSLVVHTIASPMQGMGLLAVVGGAVIVVAAAMTKYKRRQQYQALV